MDHNAVPTPGNGSDSPELDGAQAELRAADTGQQLEIGGGRVGAS